MVGFKADIAKKISRDPDGLGLSIGITPRQFVKSVKRHSLLMGMIVLALNTVCAPVTRTAHVSTLTPYHPKDASQHKHL